MDKKLAIGYREQLVRGQLSTCVNTSTNVQQGQWQHVTHRTERGGKQPPSQEHYVLNTDNNNNMYSSSDGNNQETFCLCIQLLIESVDVYWC